MKIFKLFYTLLYANRIAVVLGFALLMVISIPINLQFKNTLSTDFVVRKSKIAVFNQDVGNPISADLEVYLKETATVVPLENDPEVVADAFYNEKIHYALTIPAGFGQALLDGSAEYPFKSSTKSYSTTPKSTIKPDSGSFSTKPNTSNKNSGSSSTIKPDSGSFSTSPKNNNRSNSNNNTNTNNNDYDDYGGSNSKKSIFWGSYYGGYSPFRRVFFGYGISSWIMKLVMLITVIVVIYIVIDYIRSKRD